jgi:type IV secretory pathway VirJ component
LFDHRSAEFPILPEVKRLGVPVLCVRGGDETDSECRDLQGPNITSIAVGGGHQFGGDYARVVDAILDHLGRRA